MKPNPPQRVTGDIDRIRAQTWNRLIDCLEYAMSHPRGDGITVLNTAAGLLTAAGVGGGTPAAAKQDGYNSYFKLTMTGSTGSGATIRIADGGGDSRSYAVVNGGSSYAIPPYTETVSGGALFLLKYTPAQYNSGGQVVSGATMAISSLHSSGGTFPSLPSGGTSGAYYYQLGRVVGSDGALKIVQDHTAGVVHFNWFANCYLG